MALLAAHLAGFIMQKVGGPWEDGSEVEPGKWSVCPRLTWAQLLVPF